MIHPTPTKTLLTTTFEPLVMQLSGSLARGVHLIEQFVRSEPTPQHTMDFERELSGLLREVGRRIMAWALNQLEPEADDEAPSRVVFEGRLYRRRRQHPRSVATLYITPTHVLIKIGVSFRIIKVRLSVATSLACQLLEFILPLVSAIADHRKRSHPGLRQLCGPAAP